MKKVIREILIALLMLRLRDSEPPFWISDAALDKLGLTEQPEIDKEVAKRERNAFNR